MTPPALDAVRTRYRIAFNDGHPAAAREATIEAEDVIAWVRGFGAALGQMDALSAIPDKAPEDTRRVQALQIADGLGWFTFLWPETYVYPEYAAEG